MALRHEGLRLSQPSFHVVEFGPEAKAGARHERRQEAARTEIAVFIYGIFVSRESSGCSTKV
jgi:hypothetical protein